MDRSNLSKSGTAALRDGVASYGVLLGVFVYAVGIIAGFLTPTRLDGTRNRPFWQALAIDLGLLGLFAVQHSVMARRRSSAGGPTSSRSPPSAAPMCSWSSLALVALFAFWQPLGGMVWTFPPVLREAADHALPHRLGAAPIRPS